MKPKKTGAKKKSKGGAPKGNRNAVTHGFYSKFFTATEKELLKAESKKDVESEIKLLRVHIARLNQQISYDAIYHSDDKGNESRDEHYLHQLETMTHMMTAIAALIRTDHLRDPNGGIAQGILDAIMEMNPYEELT